MTQFIENEWLETWRCGKCGILMAVSKAALDERRSTRESFYCFNGHSRAYRKTTEDTLREEVERQKQMREAEEARRLRVEQERDQVARAHTRMRTRVMNGVCPCCNRTFQNLMRHMQTEHAAEMNLRTLRTAFGMSQHAIAAEIGISPVYVSNHECGKRIPAYARSAIESWIGRQTPKSSKATSDAAINGEVSET